jgi:CheY-like chemotaxis protein
MDEPSKSAVRGEPDRPGEHRVLVVDDNEDAASTLAEALEELGHSCEVALTAEAALRKLETFPADVALIDIGLPVMDGYELARRIRQGDRPAIRLLAVTGRAEPQDRDRVREAGFDGHLVKPVDLVTVERALTPPARR